MVYGLDGAYDYAPAQPQQCFGRTRLEWDGLQGSCPFCSGAHSKITQLLARSNTEWLKESNSFSLGCKML